VNFIEWRVTRAAESILDNENLTSDLTDEAAQVLVDWGVTQAKEIALSTIEYSDDEQADEAMYLPMKALRRMLRIVNKWSVKVQTLDKDFGTTALEQILEQAEVVYGAATTQLDETARAGILNRQDEFMRNPGAFIATLRSSIENPPKKL